MMWQREAEDITGSQTPQIPLLRYFSVQVKWRTATQTLLSYQNPKITKHKK